MKCGRLPRKKGIEVLGNWLLVLEQTTVILAHYFNGIWNKAWKLAIAPAPFLFLFPIRNKAAKNQERERVTTS
jgi:hypothetical protein